jgi:hypothetical protein
MQPYAAWGVSGRRGANEDINRQAQLIFVATVSNPNTWFNNGPMFLSSCIRGERP